MDPEQPLQTFKLNQQSFIIINPNGARIQKLVLQKVVVIEATEPFEQLGTGSYLMCPWVNRIQVQHPLFKPVFRDGNGYPLHGLVVNISNTLEKTHNINQNSLTIKCCPKAVPQRIPNFTITYKLMAEKLEIILELEQKEENPVPICFGFHPFIQMNGEKIEDCTIESNISTNLKLASNLLPIYPFEKQETLLDSHNQYDSLFERQGAGYFKLINGNLSKQIEVRSEDMHFWQVYTPPDGRRIAVEPMTFCGNLYAIYNEEKFGKLPTKAGFSIQISDN